MTDTTDINKQISNANYRGDHYICAKVTDIELIISQLEAERQRADYGQQVIDQRNAECDRLINELAALKGDQAIQCQQAVRIALETALKGDQVPVAYCQTTRDKIKHVAMQALSHALKNKQLEMADIHALTMMLMSLFTAPQKPVVLPGKKALNPNDPSPIWCASKEWNSAIDACRAAIEAAGGKVAE